MSLHRSCPTPSRGADKEYCLFFECAVLLAVTITDPAASAADQAGPQGNASVATLDVEGSKRGVKRASAETWQIIAANPEVAVAAANVIPHSLIPPRRVVSRVLGQCRRQARWAENPYSWAIPVKAPRRIPRKSTFMQSWITDGLASLGCAC